jgi:hypothetical protein
MESIHQYAFVLHGIGDREITRSFSRFNRDRANLDPILGGQERVRNFLLELETHVLTAIASDRFASKEATELVGFPSCASSFRTTKMLVLVGRLHTDSRRRRNSRLYHSNTKDDTGQDAEGRLKMEKSINKEAG